MKNRKNKRSKLDNNYRTQNDNSSLQKRLKREIFEELKARQSPKKRARAHTISCVAYEKPYFQVSLFIVTSILGGL
jgi:hypothetical protein